MIARPVSTSREPPKVPSAELLHPKTYPPVAYRPRIELLFQSPFPELYFRAAPPRISRSCCIRPQEEVSVQAQKEGAYWLRLIVGSADGMPRMGRWPRYKPDQKTNEDNEGL